MTLDESSLHLQGLLDLDILIYSDSVTSQRETTILCACASKQDGLVLATNRLGYALLLQKDLDLFWTIAQCQY